MTRGEKETPLPQQTTVKETAVPHHQRMTGSVTSVSFCSRLNRVNQVSRYVAQEA